MCIVFEKFSRGNVALFIPALSLQQFVAGALDLVREKEKSRPGFKLFSRFQHRRWKSRLIG